MVGRTGLPKSVLGLAAESFLLAALGFSVSAASSQESGAPSDEGIPRDEGLLRGHGPRRRLLHDQVLERQGNQGGLEDLLSPGGE